LAFSSDDSCPFCGQHLDDKQLVASYRDYFSAAYKTLSDEVKQKRATLGRYIAGDFKKSVLERLKSNTTAIANWQTYDVIVTPKEDKAYTIAAEPIAAKNIPSKSSMIRLNRWVGQ
jgi:wobble nucleotide-excising tRNase